MNFNESISTEIDSLPLLITIQQASIVSGIPEWTIRKYEREGKMPKGRRIGKRVYLNRKNFLNWLDIEGL